jgi:hypothetical protein
MGRYPPTMSTEVQKDIQLELAHVLFIDIVGYSKLLITDQSEQLQKLKEIVRGIEQFRGAEAEGKLLRLPSFLVWRSAPEMNPNKRSYSRDLDTSL